MLDLLHDFGNPKLKHPKQLSALKLSLYGSNTNTAPHQDGASCGLCPRGLRAGGDRRG